MRRFKILKPFQDMSNLSYELAKGNLSMPIKEEKSKLFGRFQWGMDMLREKLEETKEKEFEFLKERKTLILSLSHDIKTPLSSIELYSKALSEDLYDTQEKRNEILQGIARNVKEIKGYVNEIVTASREDFLNLEVHMGEYYISEVIKAAESYYKDKLSTIHTEFQVDEVSECLVKGDKNRMVEVLQNVMENAIKYGDGKHYSYYDSIRSFTFHHFLYTLTPIDAIRNGQTGERFRKKSLMSLGKSKLPMAPFLALNDIVSSPRRYGIISLTFFLCLSLLLILSATVSTINSGSLAASIGWADCDVYLDSKITAECMMEDGHEKLEKHLDEMEQTLAEHDIPAK